jgi:hypothetical protein
MLQEAFLFWRIAKGLGVIWLDGKFVLSAFSPA